MLRGQNRDLSRTRQSPMTHIRVFVPFACGYFLSYLFRTVNAVIAPNLVQDMGLTAADLGLLTSAYFLAFALCQIPLGVALDRYGPRRVDAVLLTVAAIGALIFASGKQTVTLLIGRALIGVGVSACLMAGFQAFSLWYDKKQLSFVNGCIMASGGLGALMATSPVEAMLQLTSWRYVFTALSIAALVAGTLIYTAVPISTAGKTKQPFVEQLIEFRTVFQSRLFWQLAPVTMMTQGALLSLQGLWVGPWLLDVAHLERFDVAFYLLLIAGAMLIGYLIMGLVGAQLQRHGIALTTLMAFSLALFLAVQLILCLGTTSGALYWWMIFSFTGSASILSFAVLSQVFPSQLTGRINTALNLLIFVCAFAFQYAIGAVIDLWPVNDASGYEAASYRAAFGMLLLFESGAYLWFLISLSRGDLSTE